MTDAETEGLTLAADFPAADRDAWRKLAEAALKGAPFEKALTRRLAEGIVTDPIYAADGALPPADGATRNAGALARAALGWDIRQIHAHPDPKAVNKATLADLERGATSVILRLDRAGRRGDTAATDADTAGVDGIMLHSVDALETALDGVYLEAATVSLQPGGAFAATAAMMRSLWQRRGIDAKDVLGHLGADPIGALASDGMLPESLSASLERMAKLAAEIGATYPKVTTVSVDTSAYHGAGANEAMDLAYALATGVAYLRAMESVGLPVEAAAGQIEFSLPVGVDVFLDWSAGSPDDLGHALEALATEKLPLAMITNRGVKVYPGGRPETFCTDHWRCRFQAAEGVAAKHGDLLALLQRIEDRGLDFIKTENLYTFDGKAGFSLGQGQ